MQQIAEKFSREALFFSLNHPLLQRLQYSISNLISMGGNNNNREKVAFCNHSDVYIKARDAVMNGQLPCNDEDLFVLGAIYLRVEILANKLNRNMTPEKLSNLVRIYVNQFLGVLISKESAKYQTAFNKVRDIYQRDFSEMTDREAKHSFIDVSKGLDTYGYVFFPVKQQNLSEMRILPRKLGISDDKIIVIDFDTNTVVQSWTVEKIRTCKGSTDFLLLRIAGQEGAAHFNTDDAPYIAKLVKKFMKRQGLGKGFKLDLKISRGCPPDPLTDEIEHPMSESIMEAIKTVGTTTAFLASGSLALTTLTASEALSYVGELARQLTLCEYELFSKIAVTDLFEYLQKLNTNAANRVRDIILHFNKISDWVSSEIVREPDDEKRSFLLKQYIFLAKVLLEGNNLNGVMEILSGLNSGPVRKLQFTWNNLSKDDLGTFKELEALFSSRMNYSEYRKFLSSAPLPCLPYFGLFLTDLTFVNDGNAEYSLNGFFNLNKRRKQYEILQMFLKFQKREFVFLSVTPLRTYLENIQPLSEDERYSLAIALASRSPA